MTIDARYHKSLLHSQNKKYSTTFTAYNKIEGKRINQIHKKTFNEASTVHPTHGYRNQKPKEETDGIFTHPSTYHLHLCKLKAQIIKLKSTNN
jgi:hypothetical protein